MKVYKENCSMDSANIMSSENHEVDKTALFDAEQFLANYSNLRDECDRLKNENQQLQIRVQQINQEFNQNRMDKENLEKHIQRETLRHKEIVWNLKLEIQRSQEERLSWKEKYLDLCIRTSNNETKDTLNQSKVTKLGEEKKLTKKAKRKVARRIKHNIVLEDIADIGVGINEANKDQVDDLSLEASNDSTGITTNDTVNEEQAGYYSIQPASFDCQGQAVSGNTATFILQTSDVTYCTTAVLENAQRSGFANGSVPFALKPENVSFNDAESFQASLNDGETDSELDENTEFNYRCNLCNFTYSDQGGLDKHMKAKHAAKTAVCKECGKAYSSKSSLAQHVHHYHRHPMAHNCAVCGKKFNRKDFLLKHLKTHTSERDLKCSHCDKLFKTRSALSAHVNGSHNEKRRFVCDFCGMRTSWRLSYLEHMKLHTGEPRKSTRKKLPSDSETVSQHTIDHLVSEQSNVVQYIGES
ncbi:zinc finger and SCAN domain-containing protein 23 isoform X4 [Hydra vulgaris]|uniref:Zinc finger and SCAN domain-containing protein 23 isoform X4 n=1 Tax=Hydra vulgaris TaxID=6087 RepID=A0ABM4CGX9_HYDVU